MPTFQDLLEYLPWRNGRGRGGIAGNAAILNANRPAPSPAEAELPVEEIIINASTVTPIGRPGSNGNRGPYVGQTARPSTNQREYGVSGTENFGGYIRREDYNPDLDNFVTATKIYDKMRRGDAQVNAMLKVLKLPLRGAKWTCLPPDEKGDNVDQAIADFINNCLFDDDAMEFSWDYTLRHILLQLEFGFSVLEKVFRVDETGAYRILRLAPRLPRTVRMWHVDRNGRLKAVVQYAPVPVSTQIPEASMSTTGAPFERATYRYNTTVSFQYLTIPADYVGVFTLEREGDNYEGISILRNVYRNYFYKDQAYHAEGVRLDRWGVGIPVANLSEGHTLNEDDLGDLAEVLKNVRANERAFLIAPPFVQYDLMPKTGSTSAGTGAAAWIDHHDQQIVRNVLAGFLTIGQDPHGTLGFGSRLTDLFVSSLNGVAAGICADMKHQVVRQLCDLNFDMTKRKYPRVTCRDLEQVDMDNLVKTLTDLNGTFIQPDDDTEKLLRKILQLPNLQPEQSRKNKAEAMPGTAAAAVAATPTTGSPEGQAGQAPGPPQPGDVPTPSATPPPHPPQPSQPAQPPPPHQQPPHPNPFAHADSDALAQMIRMQDLWAQERPSLIEIMKNLSARAEPDAGAVTLPPELVARLDRIDAMFATLAGRPVNVEVYPPDVHVAAPHVTTHVNLPKPGGVTKTVEHDRDETSPTYGQIIRTHEVPDADDDQ